MENEVKFELGENFEMNVFDFIVEMMKDYSDKTESASYIINQICAAALNIDEAYYNPNDTTVNGFLKNVGR